LNENSKVSLGESNSSLENSDSKSECCKTAAENAEDNTTDTPSGVSSVLNIVSVNIIGILLTHLSSVHPAVNATTTSSSKSQNEREPDHSSSNELQKYEVNDSNDKSYTNTGSDNRPGDVDVLSVSSHGISSQRLHDNFLELCGHLRADEWLFRIRRRYAETSDIFHTFHVSFVTESLVFDPCCLIFECSKLLGSLAEERGHLALINVVLTVIIVLLLCFSFDCFSHS
jgi:hypothetical protein